MRKFLGSGWFLFLVWATVEAGFWILNVPENGYAHTPGSLFTPVMMTILWPIVFAAALARTRR